jgi:hypothetical protein
MGIGHLIMSSRIEDLSGGVQELHRDCLQTDASKRPNAKICLERLKCLCGLTTMVDFD